MTRDEAKHLALNMLCTNYITPREMEIELAKAYLALESRIQKLEAVAEAAKDMAKRHNWTPGMGQCICPQHIAFYKSLAELDQP